MLEKPHDPAVNTKIISFDFTAMPANQQPLSDIRNNRLCQSLLSHINNSYLGMQFFGKGVRFGNNYSEGFWKKGLQKNRGVSPFRLFCCVVGGGLSMSA